MQWIRPNAGGLGGITDQLANTQFKKKKKDE